MENIDREFTKGIIECIETKQALLSDNALLDNMRQIVKAIIDAYNNGGKVLFCGNGGSAADAQHLAAELSGRYYFDRPPLNAEALHVNTSYLTAVANDYSYDEVYARYLKGVGNSGDVLIAFSTSGNSKNVLRAIEVANEIGVTVVGFTGSNNGKMDEVCNYILKVPSSNTARIQECHIMLGHLICEQVESLMFKD